MSDSGSVSREAWESGLELALGLGSELGLELVLHQ